MLRQLVTGVETKLTLHDNSLLYCLLATIFILPGVKSYNATLNTTTFVVNSNCNIYFSEPEFAKEFMVIYEHVELVNIRVDFPSEFVNPLFEVKDYYNPEVWYLSTYEHGLTLLKLPFQHAIFSLSTLERSVRYIDLRLRHSPRRCLEKLPFHERMNVVRKFQFDNLKQDKQLGFISICNQIIKSKEGHAEFVNFCCKKNNAGKIVCHEEDIGIWVSLLFWLLAALRLIILLFSPLLLPQSMYNAAYVMSEYTVKLKSPFLLNLFVSTNEDCIVRYKKRLVKSDIKSWNRFNHLIQYIPQETVVPIQINELNVKVKGKRIVEGNYPPSGLMKSLYDNFIRCKVKNIETFTECCESSIYGKCVDLFINYNITWHTCMKTFIKLVMLLLLPLPYYIRVIIYYIFEEPVFDFRRMFVAANRLDVSYNFVSQTFLQYFSPTHPVFITTYFCYILSGFIIGFVNPSGREILKGVIRGSLQNMRDVTYVGGVEMITKLALNPFKTFGILGLLLAPIYWLFVIPLGCVLFLIYSIPIIYLITAIFRHAIRAFPLFEKKRHLLPKRATRKIKELTESMKVKFKNDLFYYKETEPTRSEQVVKIIKLFAVTSYCITVLFSFTLLVSECLAFLLQVATYTMMGFIVNASSLLKYVTMALLVIVYMHDCYQDVYQNYVTFTKEIIDDLMDRAENIKEVASQSADVQENAAFQVSLPTDVTPISTKFNNDKGEPRWNIGHLSVFLDKYDTPRMPLRLFKDMCNIRTWGSPGPVYINLLIATRKFLTIVVFLAFVLVVVLAFGNVYRVSSTNQTLAAMAGGFVPLLLKNVLSSRVLKLNLKTLAFKGQLDEVLSAYRQNWPISDLVFEWGENIVPSVPNENGLNVTNSNSTDLPNKLEETFTNSDNNPFHKKESFKTSSNSNGSIDDLHYNSDEIDLFIDLSSTINSDTWLETPHHSNPDLTLNHILTVPPQYSVKHL
ncbi:uncharacterized protein LOC106884358 isoform X1 [Octopus bimaculoides]|uniref:Uncharacterized protein n=1 Tax=Octopus bimaculoides TaxID=37653 RepID=A0A0L8IGG9_OCTBM|nr:uncharacterized protein LOC106884358 isoform X1 [Octopus bimaculoides]|eukprot:XP_014791192.1 PREDICTED: uncharacterized protein LOC106884358 [Octopus bimaculoides]